MNPVRKTVSGGQNHIAAIHILKAQLGMSEADYRVLLDGLTCKDSCKDMNDKELQQVRAHLHALAVRSGVAQERQSGASFTRSNAKVNKKPLEPLEKKVWAMWYALEKAGRISTATSSQARAKALRAYVTRQTGVADMAFCTPSQLHNLIEAMKFWQLRGTDLPMSGS